MPSSLNPLQKKPELKYRVIVVILAMVILIADELLVQGVSVGEAYCALVLVGLKAKDRQLILVSAIGGTILTLVGVLLSPPEAHLWIVEVNRLLSIFMIWLTTVFCLQQLRTSAAQKESEEIKAAYEGIRQEMKFTKLQRTIAVLINSQQSIEDDLVNALQVICHHTGWPVGHLYLKDDEKDVLTPTKIWFLENPELFSSFKKVTEESSFKIGVGLPGRVLLSRRPEWIIDVYKDKNFPRARQAEEIGVHAGFAFPILIETKVMAVMEFFAEEALEPDPRLLQVMESVGYLLGRVFERYQANLQKEEYHDHLRRLYKRLESARENDEEKTIADGIHDKLRGNIDQELEAH